MQTATTAGAAMAVPANASLRRDETPPAVIAALRAHGHRTLAEIEQLAPPAKRPPVYWTAERDAELVRFYGEQRPREQTAALLGTTMHAIEARICRLRKAGVIIKPLPVGRRETRYCGCGSPLSRSSRADATMCAPCHRKSMRAPTPPDLAEVAADQGVRPVAAHYDVSIEVARRWIIEAGLPRVKKGKAYVVRRRAPPRPPAGRVNPAMAPTSRAVSRAGRAADFLQRFGPVWRCTAKGGPDPKGTHWRRGSAVLSEDEIIERAEAKGWAPDAWSALPVTSEGARTHA